MVLLFTMAGAGAAGKAAGEILYSFCHTELPSSLFVDCIILATSLATSSADFSRVHFPVSNPVYPSNCAPVTISLAVAIFAKTVFVDLSSKLVRILHVATLVIGGDEGVVADEIFLYP